MLNIKKIIHAGLLTAISMFIQPSSFAADRKMDEEFYQNSRNRQHTTQDQAKLKTDFELKREAMERANRNANKYLKVTNQSLNKSWK